MADRRQPILEGLRVVELSAFVAAPLCGATLAALGAEVIRVDPPGGGIDYRRWPLHEGRSLYWDGLNRGKRSVTIDVREQSGRDQVTRLITAPGEGAGIVVTNLPTSQWNSYEELARLRPDLIMVQITGRRDGSAAVDYTINAGLGFPFVTGPEDHEGPVNHVLPAWDVATGFLAAMAVVAAERHRRHTGTGQLVELSLEDVALAVSGHLGFLAEAQLVEEPRERYGNYVYGTFGRDFVTRDGKYVMVVALTPRQWKSVVTAMGLEDSVRGMERKHGNDYRLEADRWRDRAAIADLIQAWIGQRDLATVASAFDGDSVLWSPYRTFKESAGEHASRGLSESSPLRFGLSANLPARPAPVLGQDTAEILQTFGLDD